MPKSARNVSGLSRKVRLVTVVRETSPDSGTEPGLNVLLREAI